MAKVDILIEGYAIEYDNFEKVSPSVVLIETDKNKILVDPGFNRKELLDALARRGISTDQIDFVVLTHTHLDHCALAGVFEKAIILDNSDQFLQNGEIRRQYENILGDKVNIIQTPGHDQFHCSAVVKTDDMGVVVVAGDAFWWTADTEPFKDFDALLDLDDPYIKDKNALIESRKKILQIADFIIPGHGKIFKNLNK